MKATRMFSKALLATMVAAALASHAGNGNGKGEGKLPNGKPFQVLQQSIQGLEASLQTQIAELQAQLDADAADDAALAAMIGSLQVAVQLMEQRMAGVEANVAELAAYNEVQDALLAFEKGRIDTLQAQVSAGPEALAQLFLLFNAQQGALAALQGQVNLLASQANAQGSQVAVLQAELAALAAAYQATRDQLAQGCPAGSSMRQLVPGGAVNCVANTGPGRPLSFTYASAFTIAANGTLGRSVFCPPGSTPYYAATGGGLSLEPGGVALSNQPYSNGWLGVVKNTSPTTALRATVYVQCTTVT